MPLQTRRWKVGQCPICLGWGEKRQSTSCAACAKWRRAFPDQHACLRCGHLNHVSRDGLCRPCLLIIRTEDPGWVFRPVPGRPVQVGLLLPGVRLPRASSLLLPANRKDKLVTETLSQVVPTREKWQWLVQRPPDQPISPHLVDPAQTVLFEARRNWSCLTVGSLDQLPSLTPATQAVVDELDQHARLHGWSNGSRNNATKTLRILLAWLGADAPIHETHIRALSERRSTTVRRVLQFLDERGMVVRDPDQHGTAVQRAVQRRIQTFPGGIADELRCWVQVVRGEGRRQHRELPFTTIRSYLNCFYPVLLGWTERITSLLEITRDDIEAALDERPPATARNLLPALRSLFRALKQERIIFRDPTRGITLAAMRRLPAPIPTDQLRGLIDRAESSMNKLIVALVAIHGLRNRETRHLLLTDLDLPTGKLLVRRRSGRHTVYLDELTHTLAIDWLRERRRLWSDDQPAPADQPHHRSRFDKSTRRPHHHRCHLQEPGHHRYQAAPGPDSGEAKHTADPIHLIRVFGLTARPAMHYVQAAHPERRSR